MFKEVDKVTAIMAAVNGAKVLRISEDDLTEGEDQYIARDIRQEYLEFLLDDDKARFIIDDPDYKTSEQTAPKADQNEVIANQNAEKANQSGPEADQPKKPGKTARKDIDIGKVQALHNAGWSIAKIADEMGVSASVIQRRLADMERTK